MKMWMEKMKKKFKNEKGLTLVELLAVIVILAIVGTIAFVMIGNVIDNSKKDAHIANAQQLIEAAKLYEAQGKSIPRSGVGMHDFSKAGLLNSLTDPWDKSPYNNIYNNEDNPTANGTNAIVKKNKEGKYSVTLIPNTRKNCNNLKNTEESDVLKGRDAGLCK